MSFLVPYNTNGNTNVVQTIDAVVLGPVNIISHVMSQLRIEAVTDPKGGVFVRLPLTVEFQFLEEIANIFLLTPSPCENPGSVPINH